MNRAARRRARRAGIPEVAVVAADYRCLDCNSEAELAEVLPRVYRLVVLHDDTCPWLRARQVGRGR